MIGDEFRLALRNHWADTDDVSALLETLAAELERPRELSARVVSYLGGTYGIDYDNVGAFLEDELPKLEDDEIDLILSPVFTPKLADQSVFAELLGSDSIPRAQWPALIQQLVTRPIRARLVTADSHSHSVALREVTVERYVYRLRLDATIPASLFQLLERTSSAADRSLLKAVARQAIWENDGRRNILARFLATAGGSNNYRPAGDAVELLNLVESYKPADMADLLLRIPRRQQVLESEINRPKPFFSARVQDMHGGQRDQRQQADARISAKQNELAFLERLKQMLAG